jgi:hypothetical protein
MRRALLFAFGMAAALGAGCSGSTGSQVFTFHATARGTDGARGGALAFVTPSGWSVTLTRARVRVGPLYVNHAVPISQGRATGGYSSGRYLAQVLAQVTVDALSPTPTPFATDGEGVADLAQTGEVWLLPDGGDDETTILDLAGIAARGGVTVPFEGTMAIDASWLAPASPATPGESPILAIRQVTDIPAAFFTQPGGTLVLRVEPARLFDAVSDFSSLAQNGTAASGAFKLGASGLASDATTVAIFRGLHAHEGVYSFAWQAP